MHPLRISIVTYNIWTENRWDFRKDALRRFLELFDPDVLCLQELSAASRDLIDATLPGHRRVEDAFEGWSCEGNIYWREALFSKLAHGAEDVQILKSPQRRLFWARLRVKALDRSILVATAHLTHQRHELEARTGQSPRVAETQRIVDALTRVSDANDAAVFFMGDFNDPIHPTNAVATCVPRFFHGDAAPSDHWPVLAVYELRDA
jgi:endonuclease/exonuclease/phosphatase family metal-dependent hydrolase